MGSGSPRAKVALHLRSLALDAGAEPGSGGGASPGQPQHLHHEGSRGSDGGDVDMEAGETPGAGIGSRLRRRNKAGASTASSAAQDITTTGAADLEDVALDAKTKPASKKRAKPPAQSRKRTKKPKTPPPPPEPEEEDDTPPREIVDPLRASLTWQEDEITVYDAEDSDDDGEGMDGVGFQAPPGAARVTARKKMRQLAEYRRMVEREAREGRRRRRGRAGEAERVTRVRFLGRDTVISAV